jgi:hypothetical protein
MTDLLDYLSHHFLTEAQLLASAGLDAATLHALQARQLAPRPAYRLQLRLHCTSFFGPHDEQHELHFYASGTPAWLAALRDLPDEAMAFDLFARRYRAALHRLDPAAQADLAAAWRSFLDGTFGLCTRTGLPEDIAAKEWAADLAETLVAAGPHPAGSAEDMRLAALRSAVATLDAASSPFAPHERARSSRHRLVDRVRARYGFVGAATD